LLQNLSETLQNNDCLSYRIETLKRIKTDQKIKGQPLECKKALTSFAEDYVRKNCAIRFAWKG